MTTATHLFRVKHARRKVLAALETMAEGGAIVCASQREIAAEAGVCHKTVAHTIAELAAREEVDVLSVGRGASPKGMSGGGVPSRYRIAACARRDPVKRGRP